MKNLRYMGEFLSSRDVRWRVEIFLEGDASEDVGELTFDGGNPLTIEWGEESKEVPVCGSTATLNIVSPGDRSYVNLYTEDPTGVRMDVYRDDTLYWSGCLDPEFYEEPYSSAKNYDVSLTFSDFGALDRLRYKGEGKRTLNDLIGSALTSAGLGHLSRNSSLISGKAGNSNLLNLRVESANFYDEDGESLTWRDLLTGILQPLALRMVQRAGAVHIYDLNGLTGAAPLPIEWESTDQMLSVDKVYNNAKVTWSPYVLSGELSGGASEGCWVKATDFTDAQAKEALNSESGVALDDEARLWAYHHSQDKTKWNDKTDLGFVMLTSTTGKGASLHNYPGIGSSLTPKFFKIIPVAGGQECEGVAVQWLSVANWGNIWDGADGILYTLQQGSPPAWGKGGGAAGDPLITFADIDIPAVSNHNDQNLHIKLSLLMDPRYNPFEQAPEEGFLSGAKQAMDAYAQTANYVYIPVAIKFTANGGETYVWTNRDYVELSNAVPITAVSGTRGTWVKLTAENPEYGYLAWYDASDRADTSGVTGWKANREAINPHTLPLSTGLAVAEEGQTLLFPALSGNGGTLRIEILSGPWIIRNGRASNYVGEGIKADPTDAECNIATNHKWLLLQLPEISIEKNSLYDKELDDEDIEYAGELNTSARESIEIDTICGTSKLGVPMARGAYFDSGGDQIREITRGGRTGQAEDLLIGTLYSQFATRKLKLIGTAKSHGEGIRTYTDAASAGVTLMLVGAVENTREDTVEGTWVEVSPDIYKT